MIIHDTVSVKNTRTRILATLAASMICYGAGSAIVLPASQAVTMAPQLCPEEGCGAPGGGDPGTPAPPTTPTVTTCSNQGTPVFGGSTTSYSPDCSTGYRVHAYTQLLRWDSLSGGNPSSSGRIQSYIRFERSNGDGLDARNTRVACHDNYGGSDSDHEDKATKTTVTYSTGAVPPGAALTVTCEHQATYNNVTYSTTTVQTVYAPHPY